MGFFDAIMSPLIASQQHMYDEEMYQRQYLDSVDFTNQMLEYNKPAKQMERLKEAGINPGTLAMNGGQQISDAGNQHAPSQLPTPVSHDYASAFANLINSFSNNRLQNAQAKTEDLLRQERYNNLKLSNEQYIANIEKIGVDAKAVKIANEYASAINEVSLMKSYSDIGLNYHQMAVMRKELKKMAYELEKVLPQEVRESESREKLNLLEQDKVVAEIERIYYQNARDDQETKESKTRTDLAETEIETEKDTQALLEQETEVGKTQKEYLDKQVKLFLDTYDDQVEQIATDLKISKKQAQWYVAQQIVGSLTNLSFTVGTGAFVGKQFKRPSKVGF